MSTISELINEAKKKLNNVMKLYHYKQVELEHDKKVKLSLEIANCSGVLNQCKLNFKGTIRQQAKNIREAMANGFDFTTQYNILKDAAIGYLLVRDSMFLIRSVESYDSVFRAYELIDAAAASMAGKKSLSPFNVTKGTKKRPEYANMATAEAMEEKAALLTDEAMDYLIETGDIEKFIEHMSEFANRDATRQRQSAPDSMLTNALGGIPEPGFTPEDLANYRQNVTASRTDFGAPD